MVVVVAVATHHPKMEVNRENLVTKATKLRDVRHVVEVVNRVLVVVTVVAETRAVEKVLVAVVVAAAVVVDAVAGVGASYSYKMLYNYTKWTPRYHTHIEHIDNIFKKESWFKVTTCNTIRRTNVDYSDTILIFPYKLKK